jgi:hypothetical protein
MNTGVGDAVDLGWKLAAVLSGWGGAHLLESYEAERRPIGLRNIAASGAAMAGRDSWRALWRPTIGDASPEGEAVRAEIATAFDAEQRKVTEILGIEAGYQYVDSPIIWPEAGERPDPNSARYVPTTFPGARLPHVWLEDGSALHDRVPFDGFTLLRLAPELDTREMEGALRETGVPLAAMDVAEPRVREVYAARLILLRPDLHVAWRGSAPPRDAGALAARVTGR